MLREEIVRRGVEVQDVRGGGGRRGARVEPGYAAGAPACRLRGRARGRRGAGPPPPPPPPLDARAESDGIGAGDRVWTTRAGTLAGGARSRSTSTNFSSAATGSGASSSSSSSSSRAAPSDASPSSGDAGGPGSSFSSSKSSGLSSNASAAAEMASGSRAPRGCTTLFGPSISTRPASGTLARYVFHSTAPSSPSNTAPPRSSSSSSSTTSILVRAVGPTRSDFARNGDDIRDVAATMTTVTIAPMTTSTAVSAPSPSRERRRAACRRGRARAPRLRRSAAPDDRAPGFDLSSPRLYPAASADLVSTRRPWRRRRGRRSRRRARRSTRGGWSPGRGRRSPRGWGSDTRRSPPDAAPAPAESCGTLCNEKQAKVSYLVLPLRLPSHLSTGRQPRLYPALPPRRLSTRPGETGVRTTTDSVSRTRVCHPDRRAPR